MNIHQCSSANIWCFGNNQTMIINTSPHIEHGRNILSSNGSLYANKNHRQKESKSTNGLSLAENIESAHADYANKRKRAKQVKQYQQKSVDPPLSTRECRVCGSISESCRTTYKIIQFRKCLRLFSGGKQKTKRRNISVWTDVEQKHKNLKLRSKRRCFRRLAVYIRVIDCGSLLYYTNSYLQAFLRLARHIYELFRRNSGRC